MWKLFAFDNYFNDADRPYTPDEYWDIPRELGFDKVYFSVSRSPSPSWELFSAIPRQLQRTGLGLAAVQQLQPGDTLELALSVGWQKELSSPARDAQAAAFLKPLLEEARKRGVTISLYHHFGFWLERIEDCVRLAKAINDPNLRVTFCGYHWYAIDRTDLKGKLRMAAPWLHLANVCGSRPAVPDEKSSLPATIEPVGNGEFPLADFISGLREIGFKGDVGFQGYLIGGHPPTNLSQSLNAFRQAATG